MTLMNGLQCGNNISALWATDPAIYVQNRVYVFPFESGFAISNFLLDFFIILLPLPKVLREAVLSLMTVLIVTVADLGAPNADWV